MKAIVSKLSRRGFLQAALSTAAGNAIAPWLLNFAALGQAAAAGAADYKALVCVYLYGGNDYANTLVPYDAPSYGRYQALRPNLCYPAASLGGTALAPLQTPVDASGSARSYALAPELAPLHPLFQAGRMAVLLNVGNLIQPTTKAQYRANAVPLPAKLFSHNDQQSEWQASGPEGTTSGWGGRMLDPLLGGNAQPLFSCVNVYGNAVFLSGLNASQYQITANGPVALNAANSLFGSAAAARTLQALSTAASRHPLEADLAQVMTQALAANQLLRAALATTPTPATPFPSGNSLADQLRMVARVAAAAPALGVRRQVFFVALGGFDTHDNLASVHPQLLTKVGEALAAFHGACVELGLGNAVTTFTASDFGRTLTVNNDGSDHGWGSMHFVLGGAVNGQRYYGIAPAVASDGPDDVGQGRLLPTTSVDQYAATLGRWFGLSEAQLLSALPYLGNYAAATRDLGFMAA